MTKILSESIKILGGAAVLYLFMWLWAITP